MRIHSQVCAHGSPDLSCSDCIRRLDYAIYLEEKRIRWRVWQSMRDTEKMIVAKPSMKGNAEAMMDRDRAFAQRLTANCAKFHATYYEARARAREGDGRKAHSESSSEDL